MEQRRSARRTPRASISETTGCSPPGTPAPASSSWETGSSKRSRGRSDIASPPPRRSRRISSSFSSANRPTFRRCGWPAAHRVSTPRRHDRQRSSIAARRARGGASSWAIVPLSDASHAGYQPGPGRAMRWGTNRIAAVDLLTRTGQAREPRFRHALRRRPSHAARGPGRRGRFRRTRLRQERRRRMGARRHHDHHRPTAEAAGESSPSTATSPTPSTSTPTGIRSRRSSPPHRITIATASSTSTTIAPASRIPIRPTQTATAPATSVRSPRARRTQPRRRGRSAPRQ